VSAEVRVRAGTPADLIAVERIERASFGDPWSRSALLQELVAGGMRLSLVAERDGAVAGYLMAWRVVDQLHVLNLAVAPACRRSRVGAALLAAAVAEARRAGLVEVTLEVRPGNLAARALYRAFGFREEGVRPGYYADTGEDALILTLALAET